MGSDLRLELFVDDVDRSVTFYTEVLGFSARPGADPTDDSYVPVDRGGIHLGIQTFDALSPDHPLARGGASAPRGIGTEIVLEVDDLDRLYDRVAEHGVPVTPLEERPWGLRDFRIVDPDGYYLRITEAHRPLRSGS